MNYDTSVYPASKATDSVQLFNALGYFWRKIFQDRAALQGLSLGDAAVAEQAYYNILDLVNGYSADNIRIFEKRNWYPLHIRRSDLNNNFLLFGEDVAFGEQVSSDYYTFGLPIPSDTGVYSILMPEELREASLLADQIIKPVNLWVAGQDFRVKGKRMYFDGNPFDRAGLHVTKLFNEDGTIKTYHDFDLDDTVQDEQITLWICNAKIDAEYLKYNIGYLFGLNVPHNEQGKEILRAIVHQYTNGPTIQDIKQVCLSAINVPVVKEAGTITAIDLSADATETVITTTKAVYRYPAVYDLKSTTLVANTVAPGDVLVEAVELYDRVNNPGWWNTDFKALVPGDNKLPLSLPPAVMLGSYKYNLLFRNEVALVTANSGGSIATFPVTGSVKDVQTYLTEINNALFIADLNDYAGDTLSSVNPLGINPVDFLLTKYLASATAFLRVKFYSVEDVARFSEYFEAVRDTLPPHVLFLIVCDLSLDQEVMQLNDVVDDSGNAFKHMYYPVAAENNRLAVTAGATITSLDVTVGSIHMYPAFAAGIYDYCVMTTGQQGDSVSYTLTINGSTVAGPAATVDKYLEINDGTHIRRVRFLPKDVYALQVMLENTSKYHPGLYATVNWTYDGTKIFQIFHDHNGVPIFYTQTGTTSTGFSSIELGYRKNRFVLNAYSAARVFEVTNNKVVARSITMATPAMSITLADNYPNGHELQEIKLPYARRGNIMCYNNSLSDGAGNPSNGNYGMYIQEQDPSGALVWEWYSRDYFYTSFGDTHHMNTIDVHPVTGHLLISFRNNSTVFCLDQTTNKILWALEGDASSSGTLQSLAIPGNPCTADTVWISGSSILNEPTYNSNTYNGTRHQHDCRWHPEIPALTPGNFVISILDNQAYGTIVNQQVRGVIYEIDPVNGTALHRLSVFPDVHGNAMQSYRIFKEASGDSYTHVITLTGENAIPNISELFIGAQLKEFSGPIGGVLTPNDIIWTARYNGFGPAAIKYRATKLHEGKDYDVTTLRAACGVPFNTAFNATVASNPLNGTSDTILFNDGLAHGSLLIKDMESVRIISDGLTTADLRNISLTKAS